MLNRNVELPHADKTIIAAVAQLPFDSENQAGFTNTFCTVLPLLFEDGTRAPATEFPENGDIWWMVIARTRELAVPGRLVTARLEPSKEIGKPGKAHYQINRDNVEPLKSPEWVEILDVPSTHVTEPRQLVSRQGLLMVDHPPLVEVYARWNGKIYGPFRADSEPAPDREGWHRVSLTTARQDNSVREFPASLLDGLPERKRIQTEKFVSLDDQSTHIGGRDHLCRYDLISTPALEAQLAAEAPRLVLEPDRAVLTRAAKRVYNRKKRQQLITLLEELEETLTSGEGDGRQDELEVLDSLRAANRAEIAAVTQMADAIVESGVLEEQVNESINRRWKAYLSERAGRAQTEVEERIAEVRKELRGLEAQREKLKEQIDAEERAREEKFQREQARRREEVERELNAKRAEIEAKQRDLSEREEKARKALTEASAELKEHQDETLKQILAIGPLLERAGFLGERPPAAPAAAAPETNGRHASPRPAESPFELPEHVKRGVHTVGAAPSEAAFFERFAAHVEQSGYRYRRIDLVSFHVSAKCNDLTILGGPPGTGKSSLPRLYMEALAGDDADGMRRYLHVGVSPSWLDMRDLLGHVNTLDRTFQPAESGLYQHLIRAQEEALHAGTKSGLYLTCLDEMNLAHVEHYFAGFLQALERGPGLREVRCFAPETVAEESTFARWPTLNLPDSVRFIGTVNFDETTKQLSQRLLDRANLIRLGGELPLDLAEPTPTKAKGRPVDLKTYGGWVNRSAPLYGPLGELTDALRDDLATLGCQFNPRRFNAIRRFIASCPPDLCTPEEALDLQVAQRILPQIRALFRPGAQEALTHVIRTLEDHDFAFAESLKCLEEIRRSEFSAAAFDEGL